MHPIVKAILALIILTVAWLGIDEMPGNPKLKQLLKLLSCLLCVVYLIFLLTGEKF